MAAIGADELGQLFDQHAPALVLYARRRTPLAEDIVQEAFIKQTRWCRFAQPPDTGCDASSIN